MKESTGASTKQKSNDTVRCLQSMEPEKPVEWVEALELSASCAGPWLVFRRGARVGRHGGETPRGVLPYRTAQFNSKLFELAKIILKRSCSSGVRAVEASPPLRLSRCNEAVEMLRQAQHDVLIAQLI